MIQACTDTIQYEYSNMQRPIRILIWVLFALVSQPLISLDQARSVGECSLYAMGGTCRHAVAHSVSFTTGWFTGTLEWLTVDCCYHFLLVERVQRHLSLVAKTQYCAVLVSRGGWYQVPVSLPPLQPSPVRGSNGATARSGWRARMSFDLLCNGTC